MENSSRKTKFHKFMASIVLLATLSALYSWTSNPGEGGVYFHDYNADDIAWETAGQRQLKLQLDDPQDKNDDDGVPIAVCGRSADDTIGSHQDLSLQQQYETCPEYDPKETPILVLEGYETYGRTGNHMRTLLYAIQYARDNQFQLAIMHNSWAMDVLLQFFMASGDDDWIAQLEKSLCVTIIRWPSEFEGREHHIVLKSSKALFYYATSSDQTDFVASQLNILRTMFSNFNNGMGHDQYGESVNSMCSGINSLFGNKEEGEAGDTDQRNSAIYSVIHLRHLEGQPGKHILKWVAKNTGCDPEAALEMRPQYVKSILEPLGMLQHPIVVITDGQQPPVLKRLMADEDIGPMIHLVPNEARWIGGDLTLAVMSNVFIGNPASSISGFIARSRIALGYGHNYLFRAKDTKTGWKTVCNDDDCLFRRTSAGAFRPNGGELSDKLGGYDTFTTVQNYKYGPKKRLNAAQWTQMKEAAEATKKLRNMVRAQTLKYRDGKWYVS